MAAVAPKSPKILAMEPATGAPAVNDSAGWGAYLHISRDVVSVAAADADNDTYRCVRLPSNAVVALIWIANTAITGGTDYDLGIASVDKEFVATVLNVNAFLDAVDMSSARVAKTQLIPETGADYVLTAPDKKLWELANLAADPGGTLDLIFTGVTVGTAAGTITIDVGWSV